MVGRQARPGARACPEDLPKGFIPCRFSLGRRRPAYRLPASLSAEACLPLVRRPPAGRAGSGQAGLGEGGLRLSLSQKRRSVRGTPFCFIDNVSLEEVLRTRFLQGTWQMTRARGIPPRAFFFAPVGFFFSLQTSVRKRCSVYPACPAPLSGECCRGAPAPDTFFCSGSLPASGGGKGLS